MNAQDQKSPALTAKQRLAVSRQALIVASQQKIWWGMANMAANALLNLLESKKRENLTSTKLDPATSMKSSKTE